MKNKTKIKLKENSSPVCFAESDEVRPEFKEGLKTSDVEKNKSAKSKK
jgi:hypothetical protein